MKESALGVNRFLRQLSDRALAVFLFHGVVDVTNMGVRNYTRKHLHYDDFARLIAELSVRGTPMSMTEVLHHAAEDREWTPGSYAVTFDDGFANNLKVAAPILEAHNTPATFYVTTGFVARNVMSWADRIEYAVDKAAAGQIRLPNGTPVSFDDKATKIAALERVRTAVKTTPNLDIEAYVERIFEDLAITCVDALDGPLDRKLTWSEVRELDAHPLFSIGGHTRTHAVLTHLDSDGLREEVDGCLADLENALGVRPIHFSYPEGLEHCYSPIVIQHLKSQGIEICPTAIHGTNPVGVDPFQIRRITVA